MSRHGVWQLTKLTLNYCAHSGSSRGVRCAATRSDAQRSPARSPAAVTADARPPHPSSEFVGRELAAFRSGNPQMVVEEALRPGRHPHAVAEYGARRRSPR